MFIDNRFWCYNFLLEEWQEHLSRGPRGLQLWAHGLGVGCATVDRFQVKPQSRETTPWGSKVSQLRKCMAQLSKLQKELVCSVRAAWCAPDVSERWLCFSLGPMGEGYKKNKKKPPAPEGWFVAKTSSIDHRPWPMQVCSDEIPMHLRGKIFFCPGSAETGSNMWELLIGWGLCGIGHNRWPWRPSPLKKSNFELDQVILSRERRPTVLV